ncbi:MAG TPA: VCBS repeat-containing protein, partial [Fimbriimonadaceae bacterium]|nr:VCBS repeat-containing protein [Fimbriimonadaceae bacterium]
PNWQRHEIAPYVEVDTKKAWSNCFNTWAADLNHDGWQDQIVIGMPGDKAIWRENPNGKNTAWQEHPVWRSAGNESPLYVDLFGNGKRVLVMAYDDNYLAWFEPDKDPNKEWIPHNISGLKGAGSQRYSHGLGVADLDGDGKDEVLTTGGYYSRPAVATSEWKFTAVDFGSDCAQMLALKTPSGKDVYTTSAHARGIWQFRRQPDGSYKRFTLDKSISETHSANLVLLVKSKRWNLITGKRKWAHPPGVDEGSEELSLLVRYEETPTSEGFTVWVRHVIDESSGVGTQFVVQDVDHDGLEDIVTANKNGVFLFTQESSIPRR